MPAIAYENVNDNNKKEVNMPPSVSRMKLIVTFWLM